MRLLNPGPGECVDRITILNLKIEAAVEKLYFQKEKDDLQEYLRTHFFNIGTKDLTQVERESQTLQRINKKLWDAEDEVRSMPRVTDATVLRLAELCVSIASLNDSRAEQVKKINVIFGIHSQEKLHVQSNHA